MQANESAAGTANAHNLVTIKIKPDENGRFGFNVKVKIFSKCYFSVASATLTFLTKAVQQLILDYVSLIRSWLDYRCVACSVPRLDHGLVTGVQLVALPG